MLNISEDFVRRNNECHAGHRISSHNMAIQQASISVDNPSSAVARHYQPVSKYLNEIQAGHDQLHEGHLEQRPCYWEVASTILIVFEPAGV